MSRCTIFTGGEMKDLSFVDIKSVEKSFVICADSGYLYAQKLGLKPDVVIGDYDSLGFEPNCNSDIFTFPWEIFRLWGILRSIKDRAESYLKTNRLLCLYRGSILFLKKRDILYLCLHILMRWRIIALTA